MLNSLCALRVIPGVIETTPQKFKPLTSTTTALRTEITQLKQELQATQGSVAPAIVDTLIEDIRAFNAGAIDSALDRHIDRVLAAWLTKNKLKSLKGRKHGRP